MNEKDKKEIMKMIQNAVKQSGQEEEKGNDPKEDAKVEAKMEAKTLVKELADEFGNALKEAKGGTDKDAESVKNKLFNNKTGLKGIKYPNIEDAEKMSDGDKIVTFFKSLMYEKRDSEASMWVKALSEGTNADGGYLVPEPLAKEIYRILPDSAIMRGLATVVPMTSHTLKLNENTTDPKAYWIGEKQSKTTTSAEFSQKTLTANKLVCRIALTDELVADANVDIVNWIIGRFAEAIAVAEDKAFFSGSGTGQPRGIDLETISNQSAGASIDFDDIVDLMYLIPQSERTNASFVANAEAIQLLRKVKDGNNNYIWAMGTQGKTGGVEKSAETIMGKPIYEQNDLSGDEIYFGNWKRYIIGDRQEIAVATSKEAEHAWRDDLTEVKAVERVDGRAMLLNAFAKLTNV